jgi:hypothetical protein
MADPELESLNDGGMLRTAKDLFAGAAGGITQVLLGTSQNAIGCLFPYP